MPFRPQSFRYGLTVAASATAAAITLFVRPQAGADGALLTALFPVIAAAWFGGWREALAVVWAAVAAVQFAAPPERPIIPGHPWASAVVWGALFGAVGTAGCMTLRRQVNADAEKGRLFVHDRFKLLLGGNLVPMFLGTADGRVTDGNPAWHRAVHGNARSGRVARWDGRSDAEAAGQPPITLGPSARVEVAFRRSGGDDVAGHVYVVRLTGDEVMGVFIDQSEAKKTEIDLRREADGLIEADTRKDEALAILAHELRNPLSPIQTAAELLRRVKDQADRDRWSRIIETQVKILVRLADDLLDVMRIRQGKVEIKKVTLDLAELVGQAAENVRNEMNNRRHDFFVGVPTDGPVYVDADPTRMSQVLNNLLLNAAKYTPPGGRIDLCLERTPSGVVVRVADTGVGIEADFLPRIWDLFVQHKTGLNREGGGIGIGLTLVKKLVELHGGTVTAHSEGLGRGAEFVVTLPRSNLSWKNLPRPASAPPPTKCPRKVLVVEDNLAAAETTAAQLRIEGHAVTVVHDGESAIATAGAIRPDAILLDIGLPGMDGYEIARRLRRDNGCQAVVIAVTGCATEENYHAGADAGIDHYLLKPVVFETLRELLAAPRPAPGRGVGYEKLAVPDSREMAALAGREGAVG